MLVKGVYQHDKPDDYENRAADAIIPWQEPDEATAHGTDQLYTRTKHTTKGRLYSAISCSKASRRMFRENIEIFKKSMIINGNDYFIAYLIILNDLGVKNLNEISQHKDKIDELIVEEEKEIEKLRIMGKGRKLEDKKMFDEAIETYIKLKTYPHKYEAYRRVCICYRKKKDYGNEIKLLNKLINDESIPKYHYRFFKRRLEKLS